MRSELLCLSDIVQATERIERYLTGISREQFFQTELLQDGVIRNLEIIGEAAKNVSEPTRQKQPQIPWPEIMRMRDRLSHHYFRIDQEIVWETVTNDLANLKIAVVELIKELDT